MQDLTPKIKAWLERPAEERDLQEGATLVLQVTRNRILYANLTRNIRARAAAIEYQLRKIHERRLHEATHEEVSAMLRQVEAISRERGLVGEAPTGRSVWQRGKRADHDQLPDEIQKLWEENAEIRHRMRDAHTRLRMITPENSTCPDSDRYPWAKYLIEQDRLYRENWHRYDHYARGTRSEVQGKDEQRRESANAERLCNMLLGQYAKKPDEALAARIRETYGKVDALTDRLRQKMAEAFFQDNNE